jgi:hypothetical protein
MKNPIFVPEKPLAPGLYPAAGRTIEPAPQSSPSSHRLHLGDMMLDPRRLEAVLKAIVRRKKTGARRMAATV